MGAGGAIGRPLTAMLLEAGHEVTGTSRSVGGAARLEAAGARGVVLDLLDDAAVHAIVATARPEHTAAELQTVIDEELERLRREPPAAREVERAVNQIEASFYRGMERVGGFGGKADQLNAYFAAGGGPDYFAEDLARYTSLSPADVQSAAEEWLPADRRIELIVEPEGEGQ